MYVYVIGVPDSLTVKIGVTSDVKRRLREIQNMSPVKLEVLWRCHGGTALEQALHAHFAESRSHGEWFTFEADPVSAVRRAVENGLVNEADAPSPTTSNRPFVEPPPLALERVAHGLMWSAYANTRFTAIDAAERFGYTLPTLLQHLDVLAGQGLARRRPPLRSDRARQLFTVRCPA